jgi:hypothetical protein
MIQFYIRHLDSDSENEYEYIKDVSSLSDAFEYLESISESREPYARCWIEDVDLVVDYGSWSQYVILRFESYEAATAYLTKED